MYVDELPLSSERDQYIRVFLFYDQGTDWTVKFHYTIYYRHPQGKSYTLTSWFQLIDYMFFTPDASIEPAHPV